MYVIKIKLVQKLKITNEMTTENQIIKFQILVEGSLFQHRCSEKTRQSMLTNYQILLMGKLYTKFRQHTLLGRDKHLTKGILSCKHHHGLIIVALGKEECARVHGFAQISHVLSSKHHLRTSLTA